MALTQNVLAKYKGVEGSYKRIQDSSITDSGSLVSTALDIKVTDTTKGFLLVDRTTSTVYRLKVDEGVLGVEEV